jgi:hypothetical protein
LVALVTRSDETMNFAFDFVLLFVLARVSGWGAIFGDGLVVGGGSATYLVGLVPLG